MNTIPGPIGPGRPSRSSRVLEPSPSCDYLPVQSGPSRGSTTSSLVKTGPISASLTKRSRTQCPLPFSSDQYGSWLGLDSSTLLGLGGSSETPQFMPYPIAGAHLSTIPKNATKLHPPLKRSRNSRGSGEFHANVRSSSHFGIACWAGNMCNTGLYNKRISHGDVGDGAVLSRREVEAPALFHGMTKLCHYMTLKMRAEDIRPSAPSMLSPDALERWICSPAFSPREWAKLSAFLRDSETSKDTFLLKSRGYK